MASTNMDGFHGNILFLDFDGVCNSFKTGSYATHSPEEYGFDEHMMQRIETICKKTDARIIISSNWRRFGIGDSYKFNENYYKNPLPKLYSRIGHLIDGTLPKYRHMTKSTALELWMECHPEFDGKYAIVDDSFYEGFQDNPKFSKNFFKTDPEDGLTDSIAKQIIKHLS